MNKTNRNGSLNIRIKWVIEIVIISLTFTKKFKQIESASAAQLRSFFLKLQLKLVNYSSHIFFLKRCLKFRVTPSFIKCCVECISSFLKSKIEKYIGEKWVHAEIWHWYGLVNSASKLMYYSHSRLSSLLTPEGLEKFLRFVNHKKEIRNNKIKTTKIKKLHVLRSKLNQNHGSIPAHNFYPRLINNSAIQLAKDEEDLFVTRSLLSQCRASKKG